jgi:hypothetical protein
LIKYMWRVKTKKYMKSIISEIFRNENGAPILEFFENEEMWTQRAIDTPNAVLEELKKLKEQQKSPLA